MNTWIDVHAHFHMLEESVEEIKKLCEDVGVERVINIGTSLEDNKEVLKTAQKYHPYIHCTLGLHPHEAKHWNEDFERFLRKHLSSPEVVAVGEIGLDYYYEHSSREVQKEVFRKQLSLAEECNLPVEIHSRDAEKDTISVLKEFQGRVRGLIHCFTGSPWLAQEAVKLGFHISFSGVVTFKKAENVQEVCREVPMDFFHIETDSPFLAPIPHRGHKNNPSWVLHTAEKVAELKGLSLKELSEQTRRNALNLFTKLSW